MPDEKLSTPIIYKPAEVDDSGEEEEEENNEEPAERQNPPSGGKGEDTCTATFADGVTLRLPLNRESEFEGSDCRWVLILAIE